LPPKQKAPPPSHSENDLLTSMAARLKAVEVTCRNQREEIKVKMLEYRKRVKNFRNLKLKIPF
jgi:hypothetical protein